jgi:SAM-dependent methyltransferase/septal ring factor EnvC (AmiA/AmiB activator)
MIETTIPEISVSELMERVRGKVEEILHTQRHRPLPPIGAPSQIAPVILPKPVAPKTEQVLHATQVARKATTISRWIPKPLRGLFRRQDKFNREILRALESLANTNAQFADRLRHLITCVEVQDHGLQHLADVRRVDGEWMSEVVRIRDTDAAWMQGAERLLNSLTGHRRQVVSSTNSLAQRVGVLEQNSLATAEATESITRETQELKDQLGSTASRLDPLDKESRALRDHVASLEEKIRITADQLTTVAQRNDESFAQTNNVQAEKFAALTDVVRRLRNDFDGVGEHVRHLQAQADQVAAAVASLQHELGTRPEPSRQLGEQLMAETAQRAAIRQDLESLEQRHTSDSAFIKAELSRQSALVYQLVHRTPTGRAAATDDKAAAAQSTTPEAHRLDAFYFSFENRFRGPREEIKRRMRFYLPLVEKCQAGKRDRPIVDLGCGRGEWLELLKQQKLIATGIDLNETMIDQCKERKLKVVQADAVEFLQQLPTASQGAITGFHIIEHLSLDTLVTLIAETFRVLQPGGLAIFESPNCKNLTVGACSFYIDPTHRNPVFPETAQFMFETTGFERVALEYLCPVEPADISDVTEYPAHLRELLYGPRDFGVIGYKPTDHSVRRVVKSE